MWSAHAEAQKLIQACGLNYGKPFEHAFNIPDIHLKVNALRCPASRAGHFSAPTTTRVHNLQRLQPLLR